MGSYADLIAQTRLRVTSPDGNVVCRMTGLQGGELAFVDGTYEQYTERSLERQLTALAKLIIVARRRAQKEAFATASGFTAVQDDPADADDPQHRRYLEEWSELTYEGMSPGSCVYLSVTGMRDWNVVIKDGTLRQLDDMEFLDEVTGAIMLLLRDQQDKDGKLYDDIYRPDAKAR